MSVDPGPVHYGTLRHHKLRIAREALIDGEKTRPHYLGSIVELSRKPRPVAPGVRAKKKTGTPVTDGAK